MKRHLVVGADGMADVTILTSPIPRHISIVDWGANDRPATSWKRSDAPKVNLREFSMSSMDLMTMGLPEVQVFVAQTLDAWSAALESILKSPIRAADRAAQISAITIQAGARVAALVAAADSVTKNATKSYKSSGLKLPKLREATTLDGELDRRQFMASVQSATGILFDQCLTIMRDSVATTSSTELVLSIFNEAGTMFAGWASTLPDGIVGVSDATPVAESAKAGARNSRADQALLDHLLTLVQELGAKLPVPEEPPPEPTESIMFTAADLQRIAQEEPVAFMQALKTALAEGAVKAPETAKKFGWGDTGVEQYDINKILAGLTSVGGERILSMIASAVAGIDINKALPDNTQVASTMRSGIVAHVLADIKANPTGELATTIKAQIKDEMTPEIVETIKEVFKKFVQHQDTPNDAPDAEDYLRPALPGSF